MASPMLITVDEAKLHLRIDHDADDSDIELKILAASETLVQYVDWTEIPDEIPAAMKAACLQLVGILYTDRDVEYMDKWQQGFLPFSVTNLIWHLRIPAIC